MSNLARITVPGGITVVASQLPGVVLDCNLDDGSKLGGGTATDNTAALNAALALATATNPVDLLIDGSSLVTGLRPPSNGFWSIRGLGHETGIYVKDGSNNHGISNLAPGAPWNIGTGAIPSTPTTPPSRGKNVSISNMRINANRAGNSTGADPRFAGPGVLNWLFAIQIDSFDYVNLDTLWIDHSPTFNITLSNVGYVSVRNCKLYDYAGGHTNVDGIHVDGPANDITISDCLFEVLGDDPIALNAPEAYGGDISRVTVTNCIFNATLTYMRMYSSAGASNRWKVDNVAASNLVGSAIQTAFRIGNNGATTAVDWIRHFSISNVRAAAPYFMRFNGEPAGDVEVNNATWEPTGANPAFNFENVTTVGNLVLNGFTIYRDAAGSSAGYLLAVPSGATLTRFELNGFRVANAVGGATAAIASAIDVPAGGALTRFWVGSTDSGSTGTGNLVTATLSAAGSTQISAIQGPGVTAAGLTAK